MNQLWSERLLKFRANLKIHYDPSYVSLLVAVEQCITRLNPIPTLPILQMSRDQIFDLGPPSPPVTKEHLLTLLVFRKFHFKVANIENCVLDYADMAVFIDKLGYFPLDTKQYTADSLQFIWEVYSRFPHLPIQDITFLKPNVNSLKVHKLCEQFWIYAIRETCAQKLIIVQPVGAFFAFREVELDPNLWVTQVSSQIESNSLLIGKGDSYDEFIIIPPKALTYPQYVITDILWKQRLLQFLDEVSMVNLIDLQLVMDAFPQFDPTKITRSSFDWFVRHTFRSQEFAINDQ